MRKLSFLLFVSALGLATPLLTGCASIVSGTQQKIAIDTVPEAGAQCYLQNNKGRWYLANTPGVVCVHRSYQDLIITAQKPGYQDATVRIKSHTRGLAFGNALVGGCVGVGIDCADGAAYDYPTSVHIPMVPLCEQQDTSLRHHHK